MYRFWANYRKHASLLEVLLFGTGGAKAGATPTYAGTMPVPIQNNDRTPTTKTYPILLNKANLGSYH